ncbi:odorant receptor 74a-like [Teleopsis dalmanni]|uniref:odorant receptor 74a-like n=1 Tax=Teleopsis dalmanni TaxID=139649 RepID=UPI0018CE76C3|nr:odorant receptor 74a-like [Teleopsis dalmanni]
MYKYYHPCLSSGKLAVLPWQAKLLLFCGNWPIAADATWRTLIFVNLLIINNIVTGCFIGETELNFIFQNRGDISLQLESATTFLILVETYLRMYYLAYTRNHFREVLTDFYRTIYVEKAVNPILYQEIQRRRIPTQVSTSFYFLTMLSFTAVPFVGLLSGQHLLPYKMLPHFDYTQWNLYLLCLYFTTHVAFCVIFQLVSESNILALLILNLNGQYMLLQAKLETLYLELEYRTNFEIAIYEFRNGLRDIIKRNQELNHFAVKLQQQYTIPIFIMMGFSAVILCTLVFMAATIGMSTKNISYISWIIAKVIELIIFGQLGSTLLHTTNQMATAYYTCNWEEVIFRSTNANENIKLMKLIAIAINLNQRPISLNGLFFEVSLETVVKILRASASYFTCLYAVR